MDVASGKNIYAQFLITQVTGKKICILLESSSSQCVGTNPRIIGAMAVN
jgi:hypothetical protein